VPETIPEESKQGEAASASGSKVETQERLQPPPVAPVQEGSSGKTADAMRPASEVQGGPQTSFTFPEMEASPFDALSDMSLEADYLEILSPTLSSLGFNIANSFIPDPISGDLHEFTLVSRQDQDKRMLIRIADAILDNPNRLHRAMLKEIIELFADVFQAEARIFIVHERPPNAVIELVLKESARQRGILLGFVPSSKFRDLTPISETFRLRIVQDILLLEGREPAPTAHAVEPAPAKPAISNIQRSEILRLAEIVSDHPSFRDDKSHRRNLVEISELDEIFENFNFDRGPWDVAYELIDKTLDHGLVQKTGQHACVMFLKAFCTLEKDLPGEEKNYILSILDKYDFGQG
jgi:hypothetical protein